MKVGGKRRIRVSPHLGYRDLRMPANELFKIPVPPQSVLIFEIDPSTFYRLMHRNLLSLLHQALCIRVARIASARSSGRLESDRCRESGAAVSPPCVSGSQPKTRVAGFAARHVIHPAVDRAARRGGAPRLARSCSTTLPDSERPRPGCRHRECPSLDTVPSADSSLGSNLC
jgi:hypothetical protein